MTKLQLPALLFFALQAFVVTGQIADVDIEVTCGEDLRAPLMRDELFRQEGRARLLGMTTQICNLEAGSFCETQGTGPCKEAETEVDEEDFDLPVTYTVSANTTLKSDLAPCQQVMDAIVARCLDTRGSPPLSSGRSTFRNVEYEISISSPGRACVSSITQGVAADFNSLFDESINVFDPAVAEKLKGSGKVARSEWFNLVGKDGANVVLGIFNRQGRATATFAKEEFMGYLRDFMIDEFCTFRRELGVFSRVFFFPSLPDSSFQLCLMPDNQVDQCLGFVVNE